ncbi:DUF7504 family protein [Halorussus sp. AFM4]|uniref:DUF7504 family protein n=1 Tax=Halorussus sp. AFM4 TaxID=3421651 RepID=UPI003EC056FD
MVTGRHTRRAPDDLPPDDTAAFLSLLNELKATGCNLLVVGDAPREVFTRASAQLFGDPDVLRHRVLAVTDATPAGVANRLPDPGEPPRPLAETTRLVTHAGVPRSTAADAELPPELADVRETRITDPELRGLEGALVEAIEGAASAAEHLSPADLRVGVDSLAPLLDHYGVEVVRRCLEAVGERVRDHRAMAHYVLPAARDADPVRALAEPTDAVIELRAVDAADRDHDAQQRWHVPTRDITTEWTPL